MSCPIFGLIDLRLYWAYPCKWFIQEETYLMYCCDFINYNDNSGGKSTIKDCVRVRLSGRNSGVVVGLG